MSDVGQRELKAQSRIVELFEKKLNYRYLGNWEYRENNKNIEGTDLRSFLRKSGVSDPLLTRAVYNLEKISEDRTKSLYDRNREIYECLRYGIKVRPEIGENTETVWLIDWKNPSNNDFAIAEEVTIHGPEKNKRPDVVIYINGIALGVIELKRSTVSVSEGIRQNLDNQQKKFIRDFFTTIQFVFAGNDTEGLRYGTIETREKKYLTWKEEGEEAKLLDRHLVKMCEKSRFLDLIHNFIAYDAGVKKLCRHNQYFGVTAAQEKLKKREGGIIWHTQGSGKSLTMVWLAKWIRENIRDARVLIVTDRTELDVQIKNVFLGVKEDIHRTTSGKDLVECLNSTSPWLICSLIHKFGGRDSENDSSDISSYLAELKRRLPANFSPKGDLYVFVDECHRTQSGELHKAMKEIIPNAVFIGFTGTPLLKSDKKRSIEVFGGYIHTYKFDEAVSDKVVLDLQYEARDIEQAVTSPDRIDQWFEIKTRGLNDFARAQLKQRWGTMQQVLSSQSRLEKIVGDILLDMETRDRLKSGYGNAILVSSSIYQACKFYELFSKTDLAGKCAIVTSYKPTAAQIRSEESGEGETERLHQYEVYRKMLADWFDESPDTAVNKAEEFEERVKEKFIKEPGQMKLLIVVDKLLTGFDAPPATYLYIDKEMRDHGLFQAICRVNRLDTEDKEYGYIIDYKDLFKSLNKSIHDYTSEAFDEFDREDVEGLLGDRLEKAKEKLEDTREAIKALCEPVELPRNTEQYIAFFCAKDIQDKTHLKESEPKRLALYKLTGSYVRAFSALANEMKEAGFTEQETLEIRKEVEHFEAVKNEIKLASGDYIDLKMYEPAMRHLIDSYIRAEESKKLSAFDDLSLVDLIVQRGASAVEELPSGIKESKDAVAETIENNIRRLITDERPINPKYYDEMSELLEALVEKRKKDAKNYQAYLEEIVELTKKIKKPTEGKTYPAAINTPARRALFDNLNGNEELAIKIDQTVRGTKKDEWRSHPIKEREVKLAIKTVIPDEDALDKVFEIVRNQSDY